MSIAKTDRLTIRKLTEANASFILELLNEPAFLEFIGDKGVRSMEDAINYLRTEVLNSYRVNGFGPYLVELTAENEPVGICSLKKRELLPMPDLGFAFLERFRCNGYATEASLAILEYANQSLAIRKMAAITSPENKPSICLLKKIGFRFQKNIHLPEFEEVTKLFVAEI